MSDELSKTSVSELTDTIDRYSGGDPDAVAAGAELARRLAAVEADRDHWKARAEAAEGVVEKLPKTKDGVPVTPGSVVFVDLRRYPRWSIFGIAAASTVAWDTASPQAEFRNTPSDNRPGELESIHFDIENTYSTRESALAAAPKQPSGEVGK